MVLLIVVVPTLIYQMVELVQVLPELFRDARSFAFERFPALFDEGSQMHQTLASLAETLKGRSIDVLESILGSAVSLLNVVVLIVIVPVVSIYLLLDWDRMTNRIGELLPRDHAPVIHRLAAEIDAVLASFIRGMGTVCLILGTYYAVSLMLVGLNFGLAVGFIAGLVTFIPYLGALIGGWLVSPSDAADGEGRGEW